jgi:sigma-E factor negative regulatory protein RseB
MTAATGAPAMSTQAWLAQMREGSTRRNFQGVLVFNTDGRSRSARLVHYWQGGESFQRVETLDGQPRRVLRRNESVQVQLPGEKIVRLQQRDWIPMFPAFLNASAADSSETAVAKNFGGFYEVQWLGRDRLAGHEAVVAWIKPKDQFRFGYRLWSEAKTGLLLRADLVGPAGEVLSSSGFSEVTLDVKPQPQEVTRAMSRLEGYRIERAASVKTDFEAEGWQWKPAAPGYVPVRVVKRALPESLSARPESSAGAEIPAVGPEVLQAVFSDGLNSVSLFVEPFNAKVHNQPMHVALGATQTLMRRQGDWWLTVVGEVPASTAAALSQSLERRR